MSLRAADHHFGGFDEGEGRIAGLQGQFPDGVGGNDGGDALVADGEHDLGQKAIDDDFKDGAEQLVPAADARPIPGGRRKRAGTPPMRPVGHGGGRRES